jgi:hypothetical protein
VRADEGGMKSTRPESGPLSSPTLNQVQVRKHFAGAARLPTVMSGYKVANMHSPVPPSTTSFTKETNTLTLT